MMENRKRALIKALSWRAMGTTGTMIIALLATGGQIEVAATIGVADTVFKIICYYLHERFWNNIRFGRQGTPEYHI